MPLFHCAACYIYGILGRLNFTVGGALIANPTSGIHNMPSHTSCVLACGVDLQCLAQEVGQILSYGIPKRTKLHKVW